LIENPESEHYKNLNSFKDREKMERFFTSILNRFSIKGKLRLGFTLISLLTFALGYTGYVGMIKVKYATQYQARLTELTYLVLNLVHEEETLFTNYKASSQDRVNKIIQELLNKETKGKGLSLVEKFYYYTALMPKEIKMGTESIWQYMKDLILKITSMNQLLKKRWERDGAVDQVRAKGIALRNALAKTNLQNTTLELRLLETQCTEKPKPKLINKILDRLEEIKKNLKKNPRNMGILQALNQYEERLRALKEIDSNVVYIYRRFKQLLSTIQRESREGIASANALVAQAVSLVFWETTFILLIALLASLGISWGITKNITAPMHKIVSAIKRAKEGDFSQDIELPPRKDEMGVLATWFSELLDLLRTHVGFIIEKSGEIIQSRIFWSSNTSQPSNPLTMAKETVETLVKINKYKTLIEGDLEKREIYRHLSLALEREFELEDYFLLEMNESENRLEPVAGPSVDRYSLDVLIQPSLCRAKRTGEVVDSLEFPEICRHANLMEGEFHICFPVLMGGEVKGVLRINGKKEEKEKILQQLPYIAKYMETTAPVVYASKLLEITREQSLRDGLTGLYNRRFLEGYLDKQAQFAQRKGFTMGFLMIDIDHFKKINDTYGHKAGDLILQQLARIIERSVRSSDVVIRYGGEEFLVILPEVTTKSSAQVAEKIRKTVETSSFKIEGGKEIKITVSVGVAELPTHSDHPWQTIKFADVALYHAKQAGRNKVMAFSPDMWREEEEEGESEPA